MKIFSILRSAEIEVEKKKADEMLR